MQMFLQILSILIPVLFAITLHEVGHGWVAKQFGDRTAEIQGRLTLNPIAHMDPIGTVLLPGLLLYLGGLVFGWAKPVPINPMNLRNPKRDMFFVAIAGPVANLLMTCFWSVFFTANVFLFGEQYYLYPYLVLMAQTGVFINLVLMVFNLLPIPPLDGGRVLRSVVNERIGRTIDLIEPYGFFIVIGLIFLGALQPIFKIVQSIATIFI
jgi:Zn-dependent protease